MALFLEGVDGPAEGQKIRLKVGLRIGRTTGELLLPDPKVSALHAQVEASEKGQLYLIDRGSSNGLRISGKRVQRVALMPGVRFQIGHSFFKVIEVESAPPPSAPQRNSSDWLSLLREKVPRMAVHNQAEDSQLQRFEPMVELHFLEGLQAEKKVLLGYGPRKFGNDVLDIFINEPESPDIAFELFPTPDGKVLFRTAYSDKVTVNSDTVASEVLKPGDLIRVGQTLIEVRFLS